MSIRSSVLWMAAAVLLGGCAMMEQYHFPQTQAKVPVKVILAYSEKYPNDVIKEITEQKMFDGKTQYKFLVADPKAVEHTVAFSQDGTEVKPM